MSGHFDKAMQDIAIRSAENGGPTIKDVLTAMRASHTDAQETAALLAEKVESAARLRESEREDLHAWQESQAARCAAEHKKLFEQEFSAAARRREPRRSDDAPGVDYRPDGVALAFSGDYERERYDRKVRRTFASQATRYFVIAVVVVMLASLAYAIFVRHDDLQADIVAGLSSTVAVVMLIWAMMRKGA
jgi:hypothetical protein